MQLVISCSDMQPKGSYCCLKCVLEDSQGEPLYAAPRNTILGRPGRGLVPDACAYDGCNYACHP
jgi:hypothetical protein